VLQLVLLVVKLLMDDEPGVLLATTWALGGAAMTGGLRGVVAAAADKKFLSDRAAGKNEQIKRIRR
jgi:hypothetical protein